MCFSTFFLVVCWHWSHFVLFFIKGVIRWKKDIVARVILLKKMKKGDFFAVLTDVKINLDFAAIGAIFVY